MTMRVVVDNATREFAVRVPIGWERWVEQLNGGLPTVTVLHGGGLVDPVDFMDRWPFHELAEGPGKALADRFITFYPYGMSIANGSPPARAWNTGWGSIAWPDNDDVDFLRVMRSTVFDYLKKRLQDIGLGSLDPFNANREYLFGYSMGGMMAHRWLHADTSRFAAIWVQSAAFGGRHHTDSILGSTVSYPPMPPTVGTNYAHSLFHHHGGQDLSVVPAGSAGAGPNRSPESVDDYRDSGGLPLTEAQRFARADRPALAGIEAFKVHNNTTVETVLPNQKDLNATLTATLRQWRRPSGANNPIVEYYLDPTMTHTNFTTSPNRYFDAADVWAWFKAHPRVV